MPGAAAAGLLWTDDHVAQGFAWSPGFVSFGVPDHDGQVRIVVQQSDAYQLTADTLWAVQTPLRVTGSPVAVGTITDTRSVAIPVGEYNLVFEARSSEASDPEGTAYVVHLHFIETATPTFAIRKRGEELETDRVLLMSADPA